MTRNSKDGNQKKKKSLAKKKNTARKKKKVEVDQDIKPKEYNKMLKEIKETILKARETALRIVNRGLIFLYWNIGEIVVKKQEKQGWGKQVVKKLATDLKMAFPEMTGLSTANLWRVRQFYLHYRYLKKSLKQDQKLAALLRVFQEPVNSQDFLYEISWTHHTIIMGACESDIERIFYIQMAMREKWSSRELRRQVDSDLFTRYAVNLENDPQKCLPESSNAEDNLLFKDEYLLGFLGLKGKYSEQQFRKAILANLREFFLEFGRGLTFVSEEYPLTVGKGDFRVDLLFFHRDLRCLLAVELKISPFKPEYIGKMQFYLTALDEQERREHEMPSIGLILCKTKDDEQVRIALTAAASQIGISTYKTALPDEKRLKEHLHKLPLTQGD